MPFDSDRRSIFIYYFHRFNVTNVHPFIKLHTCALFSVDYERADVLRGIYVDNCLRMRKLRPEATLCWSA